MSTEYIGSAHTFLYCKTPKRSEEQNKTAIQQTGQVTFVFVFNTIFLAAFIFSSLFFAFLSIHWCLQSHPSPRDAAGTDVTRVNVRSPRVLIKFSAET